jgi:hypothetical protein
MRIQGNVWQENWQNARPCPVRRQKRLFDETKEAEKACHCFWLFIYKHHSFEVKFCIYAWYFLCFVRSFIIYLDYGQLKLLLNLSLPYFKHQYDVLKTQVWNMGYSSVYIILCKSEINWSSKWCWSISDMLQVTYIKLVHQLLHGTHLYHTWHIQI